MLRKAGITDTSASKAALGRLFVVLAAATLLTACGCQQRQGRTGIGRGKSQYLIKTTYGSRPEFMICQANGRREYPGADGKSRTKVFLHTIRAAKYALRSDNKAEGLSEVVRLDQKLFLKFDHRRKTYARVTFGQYAKMVEGVRSYIAGHLLQKAEGQARARLEVLLGRRRPQIKVERVPGLKEILGRQCQLIRYYEDRQLRLEEWVASDLLMPCDLAEVRALSGDFSRELLQELSSRKGFSLKSRVIGRLPGRAPLEERTVTSLSFPDKLSPEIFEIPPGYRKVTPRRAPIKLPEKRRPQQEKSDR
jgi:hypothetical protein